MRLLPTSTLLFGASLLAAFVQSTPVPVTDGERLCDLIIACATLEAKDDGEDAAPRIQSAIDRVSKEGGGTVFLKAGHYPIRTPLHLREGVTLRGEGFCLDRNPYTQLDITCGKGEEDGTPAVRIQRGTGLIDLTFQYPEQRFPDPIPYPWTIKTSTENGGDNQTIERCTLFNCWKGISIGPEWSELHLLRDVDIFALRCGLAIDNVTDIGRIENVHVSPDPWCFYSQDEKACREWLRQSPSIGVDFGRSDWEYIYRLSVNGYRTGIRFRQGGRGLSNAVMGDCQITGCGTALAVEKLNAVGLALYQCTLKGNEAAFALAPPARDTVVQFHTCNLTGSAKLTAPNNFVSFRNSEIDSAQADAGVLVMEENRTAELHLGEQLQRAVLTGADLQKVKLDNRAKPENVSIRKEHGTVPPPNKLFTSIQQKHDGLLSIFSHFSASQLPSFSGGNLIRCPLSKTVLFVTDFGASVTNQDNAAAFQRALDAAAKTGGTVYIPAGYYTFRAGIVVPSGVELRGSFDVPHHTISGGSVLMIETGEGEDSGTPFVQLQPESGLRGLGFWYPRQREDPVPYPWTVRSLGPRCWIKDVNIGNAWQGVDFATHPSDGHFISYLSGAMFRRGLFVGNCKGHGWVEDVQFNPHYMQRTPRGMGFIHNLNKLFDYQRAHLEGIVVRDCENEQMRGNFLFAAYDGIAFYGKTSASVLMHGSDTGSRALTLQTERGSNLDFALTQLTCLGKTKEASIVSLPENAGESRFYATQIWAPPGDTARLSGKGLVLLDQFNTCSPEIRIDGNGGTFQLIAGITAQNLPHHVTVKGDAKVTISSTIARNSELRVDDPQNKVQRINSK
ncbi:MAG: hypothetical protein IJR99_11175 [Kiritimatiellae bacterium]|nr:hypothetical protein [Kiritimatiellia bacterium]